MEFKVWVEGIQRVVCGVTEDTTCHDVVIALAHAIGRTGRFKLIEKWRENERLVPPSECPLKLLRSWGEYAGDVQYMLKCSGENSTRSSAGKSSYKSLRNEEKYLNNLAQHLNTAHSPPQSRRNVKRNLTFSGAHKSNILTPVKGQSRKPPLPPFENSSLDSVEEQSSLSSHSSSSPYSSFQSASSTKRTEDLGFPHIPERPRYDHFKIGTPAATSSTLSTPVTSPKVTLTNGEEDQLTDSIEGQDCRMPYENLRNKGRDCHMPYQNLENKDQDCQMPHQNFQTNNSGSHVDPHSYRNGIESAHSRFQHPKVLSQSAGVSELRMRFFNGSSDRDVLTSNSISNPKNSDYSSLSVSYNNRLPTSRLKTNETVSEKKDHKGYHASSQISGQQSQKDDYDSKISLSRINQHSSGSNHVDNQSYSMSSGMHLNENPSHQQHLSSVHFTETDENRNTKKDLSALLGRGDLNGISRDDLVRLVNLQIERLNAQEDQLKLLESEIQGCGQGDADELESVTGECESLAQREQDMEGEIEELEIVSWQDKLELEQKQYQKLTAQLETIQQNLSKCEAEFGSHTEKSTELLSSIKAEETLNSSLESEAKEKEQVMLKEVSNLQQQLNQSVQDHEANEKTLESLEVEVKALESSLSEKNMEISQVEKELKQSNLQVFVLKPMVNNSTVGESMEKSHSGRHTSESDIPFTRSSSSRAGNARKIPTTAMALKEALETEPQGYWV